MTIVARIWWMYRSPRCYRRRSAEQDCISRLFLSAAHYCGRRQRSHVGRYHLPTGAEYDTLSQ